LILVLSGPSGSGKTTLLAGLLKDKAIRKILRKSISLTTRPRRSKEIRGRDYFFVSRERFLRLLKAKKILEWTRYLGYYYATPKEFVEKELRHGKGIGLCLDLKGALRIKKLYPQNAVLVFVVPPSLDVLRKRIRQRCHKTCAREITRRLALARKEMLASRFYDYEVVNNRLKGSIQQLKAIVLKETKELT